MEGANIVPVMDMNRNNNYVRMAKAYINDPDASEGKVLDAWLAQML